MPPLFLTTCDFNNPTYVPRWLSMISEILYVKPQLVATEVQLGIGMRVHKKHAALITLLCAIYGVRRRSKAQDMQTTFLCITRNIVDNS